MTNSATNPTKTREQIAEMLNAKQYPKIYYCRHMLPGVVGYGHENLLIDTDAMKRSAPSFVGKPVYVQHQKIDLPDVEENADGWVIECFYNELDGWLWAKMIITSDEAQRAINNKWSVSNAYLPIEWDPKGQHLNVDYDRKMRDYSFTHLAIVPNPRYEEAKIYTPEEYKVYQAEKRSELDELQNSNSKPTGVYMFKIFQKDRKEVTNALPANADLSQYEVEVTPGVFKSLLEVTNAVKKNEADDKEAKEKAEKEAKEKENKACMLNDDTEISLGDEKMPMKELMNRYHNSMKKNSEKEEMDKKKEKENAEKEKEEKDKKEAEEKENAKRFLEISNAHTKVKDPIRVETQQDKLKRGSQRYGSGNK